MSVIHASGYFGLTKLALRRGDLGPEKLIGKRVFSGVGFWRSTRSTRSTGRGAVVQGLGLWRINRVSRDSPTQPLSSLLNLLDPHGTYFGCKSGTQSGRSLSLCCTLPSHLQTVGLVGRGVKRGEGHELGLLGTAQ